MISCFVGIDVSKATLDVGFWPELSKPFQLRNDPEGIAQLIACLNELEVERIVLEATGGYEKAVFKALRIADLDVVRVNPKRSHDYAQAIGQLAKTDRIDALMLAKFAQHLASPSKIEPSQARDELSELVKLRDQIVEHRDDDRRRIKQATSPVAITFFTEHIASLNAQIKALDKHLAQASKALNSEKAKHLASVKGVGLITTAKLMAYLPELGTLSGRKITALVGLAPYNKDSGSKSGPRKIEGGRYKVRGVIYMAAWVMIRHVPEFKTRYDTLVARGKRPKVAVVACMRVLLVRLNAMLRDGTPWKDHKTQAPAA
ncbi:IS110 family transposase [Pseudomonas sp. WC1]|uniref:IS110 family transposase n=1 Tax=Pseudomonas sp. WC1 TaxID=3424772 RepID=UPI003D34A39D